MGKNMKNYPLLLTLLSLILLGVACKKEKSPELEITVADPSRQPLQGIWVRTSVPGAEFGAVNPRVLDSVRTDQFGKAFFEYDNTILLRVDAYRNDRVIRDSLSILLETKRLKSGESNTYEEVLIVED